jgi:hypothetical protein
MQRGVHDIVLFGVEGKMKAVTLIIHRMLTHYSCECGDVLCIVQDETRNCVVEK